MTQSLIKKVARYFLGGYNTIGPLTYSYIFPRNKQMGHFNGTNTKMFQLSKSFSGGFWEGQYQETRHTWVRVTTKNPCRERHKSEAEEEERDTS